MEATHLEKDILAAAQAAIAKAIAESLGRYNSPISALCDSVVQAHKGELKEIFENNFAAVVKSKEFAEAVKNAYQHKLAKILVSKLEGSVEKAVDTLRSDPTIRAKMVLAIESIVKELQQPKASY